MTPRDLAPDLAPTSPRRCRETTSPLAPSPEGGEVVATSPRDLAPDLAPTPRRRKRGDVLRAVAGMTVAELAASVGTSVEAMREILAESRAMGHVEVLDGRWQLTERAEREFGWALRAIGLAEQERAA